MREAVDVFQEKRLRITPQRLAVYAVLAAAKKHLTAEEIYGRIKQSLPHMSFATVYTTLELLKKQGVVRELRTAALTARFELGTDSHHHFYCRACDSIFDVMMHPCPPLRDREIEGHRIEQFSSCFYGICRRCRESVSGELKKPDRTGVRRK
ncbi:MAG: transcriptional repressor [Candidatus Omnitrophica bacterium]|nr:transcriptional repressor [Candidatus Omnitrophota bacterium]